MRAGTILSAVAVLAASASGAQTSTSNRDSSCVSIDGRTECRKITIDGNNVFRLRRADMDSAMMKRAVLGIELRPTGTRRDTLGVFVESVTPKGPAENAGIVEGDRIAAINGVDLRVSASDVDDPYTNGLAAHKLTREVRKLTPGSRVTLRVYDGGRFRDVQVTAGRASDFNRGFEWGAIGVPGMMRFNEGPGTIRIERGGEGPDGIVDVDHLRMMIEDRARAGGATARVRAPSAGTARLRAAPMPLLRRPGTFRI